MHLYKHNSLALFDACSIFYYRSFLQILKLVNRTLGMLKNCREGENRYYVNDPIFKKQELYILCDRSHFKKHTLWRLLWQTKKWANNVDNKGNCAMLLLSLQRNTTENSNKNNPRKGTARRGHNFQIHVSVTVSDL